ncbi:MAG: DNA-processing protein DprA, partial [Candidatus Njordarchaeota archaeon]
LSGDEIISKAKKYLRVSPKDIEEINFLRSKGVRIISIFDDLYPAELVRMRNLTERIYPPLLLYHIGAFIDFNKKTHVAIVGTRNCSREGYNFALRLGEALSSEGYIVVNGLARGIDYAATLGALKADGVIVGVRPWLDVVDRPPQYLLGIIGKILENGCIISENAFKKDISSWIRMQFQLRNRIIAGISHVVVIVEARKPGGSMHQIEYALKRRKPVLIWKLKTRYNKEFVRAHKEFVRMGATEYETIDDVLDYIKNNIPNQTKHGE